jgi:hypothetical protein
MREKDVGMLGIRPTPQEALAPVGRAVYHPELLGRVARLTMLTRRIDRAIKMLEEITRNSSCLVKVTQEDWSPEVSWILVLTCWVGLIAFVGQRLPS